MTQGVATPGAQVLHPCKHQRSSGSCLSRQSVGATTLYRACALHAREPRAPSQLHVIAEAVDRNGASARSSLFPPAGQMFERGDALDVRCLISVVSYRNMLTRPQLMEANLLNPHGRHRRRHRRRDCFHH